MKDILRLETANMFSVSLLATPSDPYSKLMHVKLSKKYGDMVSRCDEMFVTADEARAMGEFLIEQAEKMAAK